MSLAALLAASSLILLAALALEPMARRIDIAVPLVFLGVGLALGALSGTARHEVNAGHLETVGTIALVLILVDGGLRTGIVALRRELAPVLTLGIVGTFATFVLVAVATHWVAGLDWTLALIVGAALSPTDPAAVFSVLHDRGGDGSSRIATVLEGEAGFNDPVAIALVIALLDAAQHGHDAHVLDVAWTMLRDGVVAAIVGVGLALILDRLVSPRHRASGPLPRSWSRWERFSRSASPQSHTVPASSRPTSSGSCSAIACTRGGRRWPRSTTSCRASPRSGCSCCSAWP